MSDCSKFLNPGESPISRLVGCSINQAASALTDLGKLGPGLDKDVPYVFNKHIDKAFGAAKVVLGPEAAKRLLAVMLELPKIYGTEDLGGVLDSIMSLIDPTQQLVIHTGKNGTSKMDIRLEPKADFIGDTIEGYTMVDIKGAIAAAVKDDLTGLILECVQLHWERDLTIADAEQISYHLEELIKLIK